MQSATAGTILTNVVAKKFRRDIEGLRAIAVLAVVGFHFGVRGIRGGFIGVDVFFVISGYLITGLLIQELDSNGKIDLMRFYGRRARRLLPAVLLMTVATLIAIAFVCAPADQIRFAASAAATSLYASNFLYLRDALDYFGAESATNPFLHTWSLGVEEQFYLVWPALLLLTCGRRVRPARLLVTLGSLTIASLALCVWLTGRDQPWAFYGSPARAWEFGAGGLAALPWVTDWARRTKWLPVAGWIAAAALLVCLVRITEASSFPGLIAVLPAAATVGLLVNGADQRERGVARILRTVPFQWIGRRSYSIYLWHWPIVTLALSLSPLLSVPWRLACGTLTVICAAASYRWVEDPIRNHPVFAASARRAVGLGACLTVAGVIAAIALVVFGLHFGNSPAQKLITVTASQRSLATRNGCMVGPAKAEPVACWFGAASSPVTIVLFGDSHADQWSTPLAAIADAEGWRLVTYLKSSCPVADIPVYNGRLHRVIRECAPWRERTIDAIGQLHPNLVVVGEFSGDYIRSRPAPGSKPTTRAVWAAGLKRSLTKLQERGSSIVLLRDIPTLHWEMRECLQNALWRGASTTCDVPRGLAINSELTQAETQLAASIQDVHFVDMTAQFCNQTTCPAEINGIPVYRDRSHMTNKFSATLAEPLRAVLLDLLHPSQNRP
jgi:peptidoglycan/LPS O-acetylase OafA/YrhL